MKSISFTLMILLWAATAHTQVIRRDCHGFTLWIDCTKRGPIKSEYRMGQDIGDFKRRTYKKDDQADDRCELTTLVACSTTYPNLPTTNGIKFDGACLVPADPLDSDKVSPDYSNHVVNIILDWPEY